MRDLIVSELSQAYHEFARELARLLPRLIGMLIVVLLGWLIAYALKAIVRSIMRLVRFDKLSENAGTSQLLNRAALPSSTELLSRFVFWVAWFGFILLGINVLGILGLQEYVARFFLFLPRLFVALFVIFFGVMAASFFSRAALLGAVNANLPSARLLSNAIRFVIILFVVSMAFEELGLAEQTVLVAFGILFGAVMLGLALAFGLGAGPGAPVSGETLGPSECVRYARQYQSSGCAGTKAIREMGMPMPQASRRVESARKAKRVCILGRMAQKISLYTRSMSEQIAVRYDALRQDRARQLLQFPANHLGRRRPRQFDFYRDIDLARRAAAQTHSSRCPVRNVEHSCDSREGIRLRIGLDPKHEHRARHFRPLLCRDIPRVHVRQ